MSTVVLFNTQADNMHKPALMPDTAPLHVYEFDDESNPSIAELITQGYSMLYKTDFDIYVASIDMTAYNDSIAPTPEQQVEAIQEAVGEVLDKLEAQFEVENILMGITASGKTEAAVKFLHFMDHFMEVRAYDEVAKEIDRLITAGIPSDLAPFVTEARLTTLKEQMFLRLADLGL